MKTSKRKLSGFLATAFSLAMWTAQAGATSLAPGGSVAPSSTVDIGPGGICGVNACVAAASVTYNNNIVGVSGSPPVTRYTLSMTQNVYLNTTFDGVTGASFLWTVTNSAGSLDAIKRVTMVDFGGFIVDVGYIGKDSGPSPTSADRGATGSDVGFQFGTCAGCGITKGTTAKRFFIQTNAPSFDFFGSTNFINGAIATVSSYQPVAASAVPEPGTLILLGSALAGMGLRGRRRSKID